MKIQKLLATFSLSVVVAAPSLAATKDEDYKALFANAQTAYAQGISTAELFKAQAEQLPEQKKKLLVVKAAIDKADAIVKEDLARIARLKKHLKEIPGLVKKGETLVKKDIASVNIASGIHIRNALFRMTLDFRGNQGRKGNLWLDANVFGIDKEIKTSWDFANVKPQMEKLGRLMANVALAEANYKANQLGIDVNEVNALATGTGSVLKASWKTTKDFVDNDAVMTLKKLKVEVEHVVEK